MTSMVGERLAGDKSFSVARRGDPARIVLAGEFDQRSIPDLTAALSPADGAGILHLDLADVRFCDLAALRVIIGPAQGSDHPQCPARLVVLHHLPAQVKKILRLTGWDSLPAVIIDAGGIAPPRGAQIESRVR